MPRSSAASERRSRSVVARVADGCDRGQFEQFRTLALGLRRFDRGERLAHRHRLGRRVGDALGQHLVIVDALAAVGDLPGARDRGVEQAL